MRTNIEINDDLMVKALRASGARTKREAVERGLKALIDIGRQGAARELRGSIEWEGDLDAQRRDK